MGHPPKDFVKTESGAEWDDFRGCFATLNMTARKLFRRNRPPSANYSRWGAQSFNVCSGP